MNPAIIRSIERILIILTGALSIYLGYLLFFHLPNQVNSQGQVILPGGISIYLSRVGPGAFLSLFGAIVIAMSFRYSIQYSTKEEQVSRARFKKTEEKYSGFAPGKSPNVSQDLELERQILRMDVLDHFSSMLRTNLPDDKKAELQELVQKTKLALMKSVWGADWGDFDDFQVWIVNGEVEPLPTTVTKAAAEYYKSKGTNQ
jgi:hypothetical protein